jgi:hypothetical protein
MLHLQSDECKCLQRLLERAFIDKRRRVGYAVAVVVVLSRKDKGCKPEVRENPGDWGKISLVRLDDREEQRWEVEEGVNSSLYCISVCHWANANF